MGVILTEYLTDDASTLLIGLGAYVVDSHHTVQDTTVYGLENALKRKITKNNGSDI